jgi:hypothetical protein
MAALQKPANSLLQQLTDSFQPIRIELGNTHKRLPVKLASSVSVFTQGALKYIFKYLENYQAKNFKTVSGHTESTDLSLYQLTSKPISDVPDTVPYKCRCLPVLLQYQYTRHTNLSVKGFVCSAQCPVFLNKSS